MGAIELKEVSVKSDKVHERGDTVSYVVGAFANSNDRSIGDVIAKMPGFDVDKSSGKISSRRENLSASSISKGLTCWEENMERQQIHCRRMRLVLSKL